MPKMLHLLEISHLNISALIVSCLCVGTDYTFLALDGTERLLVTVVSIIHLNLLERSR